MAYRTVRFIESRDKRHGLEYTRHAIQDDEGAGRHYIMGGRAAGPGLDIDWQDGPIEDGEQTGAQVEDVLEACLDWLRLLNGFVPCGENANALDHMDAAMEALDARTADRVKRKVGGTNAA